MRETVYVLTDLEYAESEYVTDNEEKSKRSRSILHEEVRVFRESQIIKMFEYIGVLIKRMKEQEYECIHTNPTYDSGTAQMKISGVRKIGEDWYFKVYTIHKRYVYENGDW